MDTSQIKLHDLQTNCPYASGSRFFGKLFALRNAAELYRQNMLGASFGTGWYLASGSCLCSAVLRHGGGGASAQHCTSMTHWPNTIQCLGSDDIMPLGIKSSAFLKVEETDAQKIEVQIIFFEELNLWKLSNFI